ncbi:MAG: beta strand repeat-containing protein, partial [Marmoricola sp.]
SPARYTGRLDAVVPAGAGTTNGCVNPGSATVLTMTYARSHYPGLFIGSTQLVAPSDIPTLLIGGTFDKLQVQTSATNTALLAAVTRGNAAAITLGTVPTASGSNGAWNPNANNTVRSIAVPRQIAVDTAGNVPAPAGTTASSLPVYLAGDFTSIGSGANAQAVSRAGEFGLGNTSSCAGCQANTAKGTQANASPSTTWTPAFNGTVRSLSVDRNDGTGTVYAAGDFTSVGTSVRHRLAALGVAGAAAPALGSWDPNAGNAVNSIVASGNGVFVGGTFKVLGGVTRNNLVELDPNTGATSWNPGTDGAVNALAVRGGNVYVGGSFANAGGSARANLAAVSAGTGNATSWNPGANGTVSALATDASNVYVGGAFSNAGGSARANLAAIDNAGSATGWNPAPDGAVKAITVDGSTVYVGGSFANVGGQGRTNAAAIDGSGAANGFNPGADGTVNAIAVNGAGVYLGGAFTHLGPDARDHVALADPGTGAAVGWNPGVNGTVNALFLVGSQVFVGGDFSNAGGAARANLAALDAGSDSALGFNAAPNGIVRSLSRTSGGSLTVGGLFTIIADQLAPGVGFFGG